MMIKGINHSIIEVSETGSEYYERAILIIKPEYASVQRSILENEAKAILHEMDAPSAFSIKKNRVKTFLVPILSAAGGALAAIFILMI